jgi:hypothetical protein
MPFPSLNEMATPLSELSPTRLSWLFVGYSLTYQIFSSAMEILAGLLLINRKTVTLGLITATGVFLHVAILNIPYDIPVKIYSVHLFLFSIFLLPYELKPLTNIFIRNRPSDSDRYFDLELPKPWMRYLRSGAKIIFVLS